MGLDAAAAVKLIKRYEDNEYKALEHLGSMVGTGSLGAALWELVRQGHPEVALLGSSAWYRMAEDEGYSAQDVLRLLGDIARVYPEGTKKTHYGATHIWGEEDLPGVFYGLERLLQGRLSEEAFVEGLRGGWAALPGSYGHGLVYLLASHQKADADEIPEAYRQEAARRLLFAGSGSSHVHWQESIPWPREQWSSSLLACLEAEGGQLSSAQAFLALVPHLAARDIVGLLDRLPYWAMMSHEWSVVEKLIETLGAPGMPLLEERMQALVGTLQAPSWDQPSFEAFFVGFTYLGLCLEHGQVPAPSQDAFWGELVQHMAVGWSGSSYQEHCAKLRRHLSVLPNQRLAPMLLARKEVFWQLSAAAPTEAVMERMVDALDSFQGYDYQLEEIVAPGLCAFGEAAVGVFSRALCGSKAIKNRIYLVRALGKTGAVEALPALVAALGDSSKGVREEAQRYLQGFEDTGALVEALASALASRRKADRLGAAQVLAQLPLHARAYEVAQAALAKEKVKEIRQLLEHVAAPVEIEESAGAGGEQLERAREVLLKSEGEGWEAFSGLGMALGALFHEIFVQESQRYSIYGDSEILKRWVGALKVMPEQAQALEMAVQALPNIADWGKEAHLEALEQHFGTQALLQSASERLSAGLWKTLPGSGKRRTYWESKDALAWLGERCPELARPALLKALEDTRKTSRAAAAAALAKDESQAWHADVAALLQHKKADVRQDAAALLGVVGARSQLGALEEALQGEKAYKPRRAMEEAVATLRAGSLEVGSFSEDAAGDAALDAALAALPGQAPVPVEGAPAVRWGSGAALSQEALRWLLSRLPVEADKGPDEILHGVMARVQSGDKPRLCRWLLDQAYNKDQGWPLYMLALLGGPEEINALGERLEVLASSQRTRWGEDGVAVMARAQGALVPLAARWLDHWQRRSRRDALRWRAAAGLRKMAADRQMDVDTFLEEVTPDFGFDAQGRRLLDYGARQITALLRPDLKVEFEDERGKVRKTLPAARKDEDPIQIQALRVALGRDRKELTQVYKALAQRLEQQMCSGAPREVAQWRRRFEAHPVFRAAGRGLVFAWEPAPGQQARHFWRHEEAWQTLEGDAFVLPDQGQVRVAHPAELGQAQREAAAQALRGAGIEPAFAQLERRCFTRQEIREELAVLLRGFEMVTEAHFLRTLSNQGYTRGARQDAGLIHDSSKALGAWLIALQHSAVSPEIMESERAECEVHSIAVHREGQEVPMEDWPVWIFSEVMLDVHALAKA